MRDEISSVSSSFILKPSSLRVAFSCNVLHFGSVDSSRRLFSSNRPLRNTPSACDAIDPAVDMITPKVSGTKVPKRAKCTLTFTEARCDFWRKTRSAQSRESRAKPFATEGVRRG